MRRYDLDWLRVLVFILLIFYHVGMLFVPWEFHIKNNIICSWLQYPMWFVNQWRLPILFVISGMGTYYALHKRSGIQFALERVKRLLIPLAFGMVFIIPPQVYVERLVKHEFRGNYFDFWTLKAFAGVYPAGNFSWHHLWFLPYLLLFSIMLIPVFLYFKKHPQNSFSNFLKLAVKNPLGLYLFIIPMYFTETFLRPHFPVTHNLVSDWYTFINYLILFFYGYILITVKDNFWETVEKGRKSFLLTGIISFTILLFIALSLKEVYTWHYLKAFLQVLSLWSWILTLFGFAARYLNRESKILSYSNEAVYPFYILHQTVMIVIAYSLISLNWTPGLKIGVLIIGTFGITWLLYEYFIRRWKFIRPFFGLKKKAADKKYLHIEFADRLQKADSLYPTVRDYEFQNDLKSGELKI